MGLFDKLGEWKRDLEVATAVKRFEHDENNYKREANKTCRKGKRILK